jgi:hypothetical protein
MSDKQKAPISKTLLYGLVVLLIALVIYYGAFRAMESVVTVPATDSEGTVLGIGKLPLYLLLGHSAPVQGFWQSFFLPAFAIDRVLRIDHWTAAPGTRPKTRSAPKNAVLPLDEPA